MARHGSCASARVRIQHLVKSVQYNGKEGIVLSEQGDRVRVMLLHTVAKEICITPSNARILTQSWTRTGRLKGPGHIALSAAVAPDSGTAALNYAAYPCENRCPVCREVNEGFPYPCWGCVGPSIPRISKE